MMKVAVLDSGGIEFFFRRATLYFVYEGDSTMPLTD